MAKTYALLPESVTMYNQKEALREVNDMSKNLVNGEYTREYVSEVRGNSGRLQLRWLCALAAVGTLLVASLLALTVIRELQIVQLRQEVRELMEGMASMRASVDSLNQTLSAHRTNIDDTIYTDEDQEGKISIEDSKDLDTDTRDKANKEYIKRLPGLTDVLENDDDLEDDDDIYDGDDDAESGDWYSDYDKRENVGISSMVKLKPEDFTETVVSFNSQQHPKSAAVISEIKRQLNENPENPNITFPPMPTTTPNPNERQKRSVDNEVVAASVDNFAAPRTLVKSDERRKMKKFESTSQKSSTVSRMTRNSNDEDGGRIRRPFIAAHFHGNTSHLNPEIHEHFKGNGLIRVAHEAHHNVWYPATWTAAAPLGARPTLRNGHVHVHHTGIYLVYVQIYYLDTHDTVSWVLHRTNAEIEGRETVLQCTQSSHSADRLERPNTCFSSAAIFLKSGDRLAVRNTGGDRQSLMEPEKSFIGLIKLADAEDPISDY